MQIRGLHRSIYRGARLSSCLDAQASTTEAARRDDLLRRWQQARRGGLTAQAAADLPSQAVLREVSSGTKLSRRASWIVNSLWQT